MKRILPISVALFFLFSCSGGKKKEPESPTVTKSVPEIKKDSFQRSVAISSVVSNQDASLSYALYLPHQYNDSTRLPAFIFFDPHADGALPLNKYQKLSEKFGVILIGSNDSKNGLNFDRTNAIAQRLTEEAIKRFHVNEKLVSLCGFSGGAKVTLVAGMTIQGYSSVVYCGAGIPAQQVSAMPPALAFAGLRDLNYSELIATDEALESKKIGHSLLEWTGRHEWPDSIVFEDAFYWIRFRAMEAKADSLNHDLVNEFKNKASEFRNKNHKVITSPIIEWWRLKKMISFLNGIADVSGYVSLHESLTKSKEFKSDIQKLQAGLALEKKIKQDYYEDIERKDTIWWKGEIARLNNGKAGNMMNDRLLGYISLMCYSLANSTIKSGDFETAQKALTIYKLTDPQNPDRAFFEACLYARQSNKAAALSALREAMRLGFKDKAKLQEEQSLVSIRSLQEFNDIIK